MNVKGEKQFNVSRTELWTMLMDPEVLAQITPGVSNLELLDQDTYKTISKIKIGPVGGEFKGDLKVVDKNEPSSFALEMKQLSKIGNADVRVNMQLSDTEDDTVLLKFDGKAKPSGTIARMGQRVLSGVANAITKEVFNSLDEHIAKTKEKTNKEAPVQTAATEATVSPSKSQNKGLISSLIVWVKKLFGG